MYSLTYQSHFHYHVNSMLLPKQLLHILAPKFNPDTPPEQMKRQQRQRLIFLATVGVLVFILGLLTIIFVLKSSTEQNSSIEKTDPAKALEKSQKEKEEASKSAQEAAKPLNRLQKAFDEIIGSNSLKKKLTLDQDGLATIDYVISSTDGIFIIKTSYENFADFAIKVFNIPEVQKLSISAYATKFVDQYGQPNQVALKLSITRETNEKVNWAVKKYAYKDYPTILTSHEVSPSLAKDYQVLIRSL